MTTTLPPTNPGDRIQVLDYPYALPSKCVICGGGAETGRKFVDFGMQLDVYGAVYFCDSCITNMANALGFVTPEKYGEATTELFDTTLRCETLEGENEEFRRVFSTLRGLGAIVPDVNSGVSIGSILPETKPEPELPAVSKSGSKKSKADGSSSVERPRDFPKSDSDILDGDPLSF